MKENEISVSDRKKVDLEKTGELPAEKIIDDEEGEAARSLGRRFGL